MPNKHYAHICPMKNLNSCIKRFVLESIQYKMNEFIVLMRKNSIIFIFFSFQEIIWFRNQKGIEPPTQDIRF